MADLVLDEPRTFPGDVNPPPKSSGVKASTPTASSTDVNLGTSPPPVALETVSPGSPTFRVVTHPDGSRRGVMSAADFQTTDMGLINIDSKDADAILHVKGQYDNATESWTVDEKTMTSLLQGRPDFAENTIKKWKKGEVGLVQNMLGLALLDGSMSPEEVASRSHEEDLKVQLGQQPGVAYNGLGAKAADIIRHPLETQARVTKFALEAMRHPVDTAVAEAKFVAEAARFIVGESAEQGPNLREAVAASAMGAAQGAAAGAVATMAMPVLAAGAVPLGAEIGGLQGGLTYFMKSEAGSTAIEMQNKGYDLKTIRKMAPIAGAIKGTLEMASFGVMTKPFQTAFVRKVLATKAVNAVLKSSAGVFAETLGAEIGTEELQLLVDVITNNMAASIENKPKLRIDGGQLVDQAVETAVKTGASVIGIGALGAGVTALGNRALTKIETKLQEETTARIKKDQAREAGTISPAEGAVVQAGQIAPEIPVPTTLVSQPGVVSVQRNPSNYQASADSMAGHPTFVKASEEAAKSGVDPSNFKAVVDLYDEANNRVHKLRMKYGIGPGLKPTEEFKALSETEMEVLGNEIADAGMKRIQTEPLAYLLVTGTDYLSIANKNLKTDPAAIQAWEAAREAVPIVAPAISPATAENLIAGFEAGNVTAEDLITGLAKEEKPAPIEKPAAPRVAPAEKKTLAQKTQDVAVAAAITAKESDLREVNTLLAEATAERARAVKAGESTGRRDQKINALLDEKEGLLADIADLKTPVVPPVPRPMTLELKAATLEDIVEAGFKEGGNQAKARAKIIKAIASENKLTDADVKGLLKSKNLGLLGDTAFDNFVETFKTDVAALVERKSALADLHAIRKEKQIKGEQNIKALHKLPPIRSMTTAQIRQYIEILSKYETEDVALTPKRIKALEHGELAGATTMREVLTKAAAFLKHPVDAFKGLKPKWFHAFSYDTFLATEHPFLELLVHGTKKAKLKAEAMKESFRTALYDLGAKAIASRRALQPLGTRVADFLAPQQAALMAYIEEQEPAAKIKLAAGLTKEELALAEFLTQFGTGAFDYLQQNEELSSSRFLDAYVPHIKRPVSEMIRDIRGLADVKAAITEIVGRFTRENKEVPSSVKNLGMKKFFKNTIFRSEEMAASKNVIKAFEIYADTFYDKVALDEIVPTLETTVRALATLDKSEDAKAVNAKLMDFVKMYLNAKKGKTDWVFEQGSTPEGVLRFGSALAAMWYIAGNVTLTAASPVGEFTTKFISMGPARIALAKARKLTAKGKAILAAHREFTGQGPLAQLKAPGRNIEEMAGVAAYGLFKAMRVVTMEDLLLGNMTPAEFEAGKISTERMADIQTHAGRWIDVSGSKSAKGASVSGAAVTQFKGWMIPPMVTIIQDAIQLKNSLLRNEGKHLSADQAWELLRLTQIGLVALFLKSQKDDDDESFIGKLYKRIVQESFSPFQALSPLGFLTPGVGVALMTRLARDLYILGTLERYQSGAKTDELKGVDLLTKQHAPAIIKQFQSKE